MANAALQAAIDAAANEPVPAPRWTGRVTLGTTRREIGMDVPADITPLEIVELVGFLTTALPREIFQATQQPASRILVPR